MSDSAHQIVTAAAHNRLRPDPVQDVPVTMRQIQELAWSDISTARPTFEQVNTPISVYQGLLVWLQIGSDWPQMGQIRDFFRSDFTKPTIPDVYSPGMSGLGREWLRLTQNRQIRDFFLNQICSESHNVLKYDPGLVPFWLHQANFGVKPDIPATATVTSNVDFVRR